MSILAYSLITIPDFETGSKLHHLNGLDNKGTAKALFHLQAQQTGNECLPSYLQQIVAISLVLLDQDDKVQTVTLKDEQEADILNTFFDIIEGYQPTITTWDGEYFNAEVVGYRSIKQALQMSPYYENKDNHFNLNHAMVSSSATTPIEDIATLLGLEVQENKNSRTVCELYLSGKLDDLYAYSENNALNTYQIYLRYQHSHGKINEATYLRLIEG
jgi:predicted PolB exonuclease-like 3'-5' exonuclease